MEEVEEQASLVSKELREKSRDYELLKRTHAEAQRAVQLLQVNFCKFIFDLRYFMVKVLLPPR